MIFLIILVDAKYKQIDHQQKTAQIVTIKSTGWAKADVSPIARKVNIIKQTKPELALKEVLSDRTVPDLYFSFEQMN